MRIEVLALMACQDHELAPAFGAAKKVGSVEFQGATPPDASARERYVRTEALMIVHHASEALLRLFFAHVEHDECPWLGMSSSTNFAKFKQKVKAALEHGFDRKDVAIVFLGGVDQGAAHINLSDSEFADAVDGLIMLLADCANRFLGDSFLYNSVKHGLSAIDLDDDQARIVVTSPDGEQMTLHTGSMHVFLHKMMYPDASDDEQQWFFTMSGANPERDLAVSTLIMRAAESLWDVARRRYLGVPGEIYYISRPTVELAIYGTVREAGNLLKSLTSELIKVKPDGTADATHHRPVGYVIPREWRPESGVYWANNRLVELPVREQDAQIFSTGRLSYLPIVPRGFQRG